MGLIDFIQSQTKGLPGAKVNDRGPKTKNAIIALAYFTSGKLGGLGASYTISGGSAAPITPANLPDVLIDLAFKGDATLFFNGTIIGSKEMGQRIKLQEKFGTQAVEQESGQANDKFTIKVKDYDKNVDHFNALAFKSGEMDVILFTNNSFYWLEAGKHQPVFSDMGHNIGGDANQSLPAGSLTITSASEMGEISPVYGVLLAKLAASRVKFTFGAASGLTNLTAAACEPGGIAVYNRTTTAQAAALTKVVVETATCVTYSIKQLNINALGTNDVSAYVTVHPTTGVVSLTSAVTAGTYDFIVVAETPNGIWGSYEFRVKAT